MELKLYDTLTRQKRVFAPLDRNNVRMYVCGPTVYDFAHIGNARPVIVFDVLFRLLRHLYGADHVTYVRNITDVDDKIILRAAEEYPALPLNEAIRQVTEKTDKQFHEDVAALGCLPPTVEPRATEHIAEMKEMIERLVASGNAYVADDNILFSVRSMPDYGKLAKRSLDEMIAGARVEVAPYKRDPMDFILWKPSKQEAGSAGGATGTAKNSEPSWPSPCGIAAPGRPGWHIECSAMSWKYLGEIFDIHGGGIDLVFPHHEDEIAQSRCAFNTPAMANYWMHNGFLQVEGEKMSKSTGNFLTIHELLKDWPGEVIRFNMLRTHYRKPIDWTLSSLDEAHKILWDWYENLEGLQSENRVSADAIDHLCDDLNTSRLIAELHNLRRKREFKSLLSTLKFLGFSGDKSRIIRTRIPFVQNNTLAAGVIGENRRLEAEHINRAGLWTANSHLPLIAERIDSLIAKRNEARKAKNFEESDRIRDELAKMGVVLKDTKDGTTWEIAR